ncbi:hypothetical protein [Streptomyces lydicus]|uniref:hypothetical protein n=1 Tax=Streptomyces lydicus TaxID=47763 RepID=UPI001010CF14|nr:hypothetical protein [Streptomyces lydicus]MCZ1012185.1 hypothetical protein [Streptomyces lydicus]
MGDLRPSPAQIPPQLLHDPDFVRAARARDFTTMFAMTHDSQVSYCRMAEACEMKHERIAKIARGEATVTAMGTIERIADGLQIPGALLGLAARPWEHRSPTPHLESDDGDDPVNRRQLLHGALAVGLTGAALSALTDTRRSVDLALAADSEPAELSDLELAAEAHGYGYHGQPPTTVLTELAADFAALQPLLDSPQPAATRMRVCHTVGQMAGMIAIILHDLGARHQAKKWFATAAKAASESGDRQLHAWVLAREAMVPLNYGAPRAAAALAEQARQIAGTRPTASATLAAAVAARAYALSHQPEQARQALRDADTFMDKLAPSARADTWLTHGEQKHHVHLSHALTALGDTRRAQESQQRALALSAPTSTMTRSLLAIDAAACLHKDGDTQQACWKTVDVLKSLPAAYRTGLIHRRATDLCRSIPAHRRTEHALTELQELLMAP